MSTTAGKKFTASSVAFLAKNAGRMSTKSLARVLHRTENSVRMKAKRLGISLKVTR